MDEEMDLEPPGFFSEGRKITDEQRLKVLSERKERLAAWKASKTRGSDERGEHDEGEARERAKNVREGLFGTALQGITGKVVRPGSSSYTLTRRRSPSSGQESSSYSEGECDGWVIDRDRSQTQPFNQLDREKLSTKTHSDFDNKADNKISALRDRIAALKPGKLQATKETTSVVHASGARSGQSDLWSQLPFQPAMALHYQQQQWQGQYPPFMPMQQPEMVKGQPTPPYSTQMSGPYPPQQQLELQPSETEGEEGKEGHLKEEEQFASPVQKEDPAQAQRRVALENLKNIFVAPKENETNITTLSLAREPRTPPPLPSLSLVTDSLLQWHDRVGRFALSYKQRFIDEGRFFELRFLDMELKQNFYQREISASQIYRGLQRLMQMVEGVISTTLHLQPVLTLYDLEQEIILAHKEFSYFEHFDDLRVGPLISHPRVIQAFRIPDHVVQTGVIPEITVSQLVNHMFDKFPWGNKKARVKYYGDMIDQSIDSFAQEQGYNKPEEMCFYVRYPKFISLLMKRNLELRSKVEDRLEEESMRTLQIFETDRMRRNMDNDEHLNLSSIWERLKIIGSSALVSHKKIEALAIEILCLFSEWGGEDSSSDEHEMIDLQKFRKFIAKHFSPIIICAFAKISVEYHEQVESFQDPLSIEEELTKKMTEFVDSLALDESDLAAVDFLVMLENCYYSQIKADGFPGDAFRIASFINSRPQLKSLINIWLKVGDAVVEKKEESENEKEPEELNPEEDIKFTDQQVLGYLEQALAAERSKFDASKGCLESESILAFISEVESSLIEMLRVKTFEEAGHGSFVAFFAENLSYFKDPFPKKPKQTSATTQTPEQKKQRQKVVAVASQVMLQLKNLDLEGIECYDDLVEQKILCHFKCPSLQAIGFNCIGELMEETKTRDLQQNDLGLPTVTALMLNEQMSKGNEQPKNLMGQMGEIEALKAICCCPALSNIQYALKWEWLFRENLGNLEDFLVAKQAYFQSQGISFLDCGGGAFLKMETRVEVSYFTDALSEAKGSQTASVALSLCMGAGNLSLAPITLLSNHIKRYLDETPVKISLKCMLEAIVSLPIEVCAGITFPVFLQPLFSSIPEAEKRILDLVNKHHDHKQIIHQLGLQLGISEWVNDFRSNLFLDETELQSKAVSNSFKSMIPEEGTHEASESIMEKNESKKRKREDRGTNLLEDQPKESKPLLEETDADNQWLCQDIAKSFGSQLHTELNAEGQHSLRRIRSLATRAMQRLSDELYSKDIHFLLELIQNADDNTYPCHSIPSMSIVLKTDSISLHNNEVGFTAAQVRALCSIGESTKRVSDVGYIGNKGIGFKSVFQVTKTPEVHSRNFHFFFDGSASEMGYITPKALPAPDNWDAKNGGTVIYLPFKGETNAKKLKINKLLYDIHPSILLFLHKLRRIEIEDASIGMRCKMECTNDPGNPDVMILNITRTKPDATISEFSSEKWFKFSKVLPVQVKRADIQQTEICLAFPLVEDSQKMWALPQQDVFAFLPLQSYGFKFIIQADWVVPSSRESVTACPWNEWLRDEITDIFVSAIKEMLRQAQDLQKEALTGFSEKNVNEAEMSESEDGIESQLRPSTQTAEDKHQKAKLMIELIFNLIPSKGQVLGFFQPVHKKIISQLQQCQFVPVMNATGFSVPHLSVIRPEDDAMADMTENFLRRLNYSYVDPTITIPSTLISELGIRTMDASLIFDVLATLAPTWKSVSEVNIEWYIWVLETIERNAISSPVSIDLRSLRIVPLSTGIFTSIKEGAVYEISQTSASKFCFMKKVRALHQSFFKALKARPHSQALFARLGISRIDGRKFLLDHVVAHLCRGETSPDDLVSLLVFAKQQEKLCRKLNLWKILKERAARILCEAGLIHTLGTPGLHLGPTFKSQVDPNKFLPRQLLHLWPTVSTRYFKRDCDSKGWRDIFLELGATDFLDVQTFQFTREDWPNLYKNSPELNKWMEGIPGALGSQNVLPAGIQILDYGAAELVHICRQLAKSPDVSKFHYRYLRMFFKYLKAHWNSLFPGFSESILTLPNKKKKRKMISSLLFSLKTNYLFEGNDNNFYQASQLFLPVQTNVDILGKHCVYTAWNFSSDMISLLEIQETVTPRYVMNRIKEWSLLSDFSVPINQMKRIYLFLVEAYSSDLELEHLVKEAKVIFVPHLKGPYKKQMSTMDHDKESLGRFYFAADCVLSDPSGVLEFSKQHFQITLPTFHTLSSFYGAEILNKSKNCFLQLGILETPNLKDYVMILKALSAVSKHPSKEACMVSFKIYSCWAQDPKNWCKGVSIQQNKDDPLPSMFVKDLKNQIDGSKIFPTAAGYWGDSSDIYFFDDTKAGKVLTSSEGYIALPKEVLFHSSKLPLVKETKQRALVRRLYVALGFCSLRESCSEVCNPSEDVSPKPLVQSKVICVASHVIQAWASTHHSVEEKKKLQSLLQGMSVVTTSKVLPAVKVCNAQGCEIFMKTLQETCCFYEKRKNTVTISKDYPDLDPSDHSTLATQLSKVLGPEEDQAELARCLQRCYDHVTGADNGVTMHKEINDFLQSQNLVFPSKEELWLEWDQQEEVELKDDPNNAPKDEDVGDKELDYQNFNVSSVPVGLKLSQRKRKKETPVDDALKVTMESTLKQQQQQQAKKQKATPVSKHSSSILSFNKDGGLPSSIPHDTQVKTTAVIQSSEKPQSTLKQKSSQIKGNNVEAGEISEISSYHGEKAQQTNFDTTKYSVNGNNVGGSPEKQSINESPADDEVGICLEEGEESKDNHHSHDRRKSTVRMKVSEGKKTGTKMLTSKNKKHSIEIPSSLFKFNESTSSEKPVMDMVIDPITVDSIPQKPLTRDELSSLSVVGYWGEQYVSALLQQQFTESSIEWMNETDESGCPYDFIIQDTNENVQYCEVKTTTSGQKKYFELSFKELEFSKRCADYGICYSIYRVVLAESGSVQVFVLKDPSRFYRNPDVLKITFHF